MGVVELAGIGLIATSGSVALVALTRYLIVRVALRDAKPEERPAILTVLPPVLDTQNAGPGRRGKRDRAPRHR